jgi:hypothetical protein
MKKKYLIAIIGITLFFCNSCKKYLDAKPDKTFSTPSSLQDLQAILDNYGFLNRGPGAGYTSADEFYLTFTIWDALTTPDKDAYIWGANNLLFDNDWNNMYKAVFYANTVLDNLKNINTEGQQNTADIIRGSALFYRAWAFYQIAQIFADPYNANTANVALGIPLRLNSNFSEPSTRATVQQTYDRIIQDLQEALPLLSNTTLYPTRPGKPAAFALLARTYLVMNNYAKAKENANSCLLLYNALLDYNDVNWVNTTNTPFYKRFNPEIIFHAYVYPPTAMNFSRAKIDSALYLSYTTNDKRRTVFFRNNADNTKAFKGSYEPSTVNYFNGIAADEVYLIRAECNARSGDAVFAMKDLNDLLRTRWLKVGGISTYVDQTAMDATDALNKILVERKKELLYRGTRWSDLRRLNQDSQFAITIKHGLYGSSTIYALPPNDLRYTLLIPQTVINLSGIQQNKR